MRVTVASDVDVIILDDESPWSVTDKGIDGWYGTTDPRASLQAIPQQRGAYWPSFVLPSHRVLTIHGEVWCRSSVEQVTARRRINDLAYRDLTICVEDSSGPLTVTGFISSDPDPTIHWTELHASFSLIVTAPDPTKYGPAVALPVESGVVTVENIGTADVWPTFTTEGHTTALSGTLGGHTFTWEGDAMGLTLDCAAGVPLSGGVVAGALLDDDLFMIPPGQHTLTVASDAPVTVTVRSGWK